MASSMRQRALAASLAEFAIWSGKRLHAKDRVDINEAILEVIELTRGEAAKNDVSHQRDRGNERR